MGLWRCLSTARRLSFRPCWPLPCRGRHLRVRLPEHGGQLALGVRPEAEFPSGAGVRALSTSSDLVELFLKVPLALMIPINNFISPPPRVALDVAKLKHFNQRGDRF